MKLIKFNMFLRAIFCCLALMGHAWAGSPVTVRVDIEKPIRTIPEDFCGLSYETKMVLPNTKTGKHYFRGDNLPLITAFKTLGIKHLRVGAIRRSGRRSIFPMRRILMHSLPLRRKRG